jgi:N-acetylglucosamine kinase-like BadF-type ATPase
VKSEAFHVGIDLGGSGTRAALADGCGNVVALGRGPTGLVSGAAANRRLARALDLVLAPIAVRIVDEDHVSIVAGTRGLSVPGRRERLELELTTRFPRATVQVSNDAHIGLWGGLAGAPGVAVVAGAGSIALARSAEGREGRAGGWGYVLGDEGSGYWLGREAIRGYLRHLEGRTETGELTRLVAEAIKRSSVVDVLGWFYGGHDQVERLAALAPLVSQAAARGDDLAVDILERAGHALAGASAAAARQVFAEAELQGLKVVCVGGVWAAGTVLDHAFGQSLGKVLPGAERVPTKLSPLGGALLLAMHADQTRVDTEVVERLAERL